MADDLDFIKLDVQGRIKHIQDNLLLQDPLLATHLAAIHSATIQHEELVHLLSDEEIRSWVAGQIKHTGSMLTAETTKASKATVAKRIPKTSVDDL